MSVAYQNEIEQVRRVDSMMQWHPWTPDWKLNLTKVPNTIITCRLCRGSKGVIAADGRGRNFGEYLPCPNCDATGIQKSDHIDTLWGRNR